MTSTHVDLVREIREQFQPVLDQSPDGIYLWLDETHKVCNEKLASMFGYTVEEWQATAPFLESFVAPDDRDLYSLNYHSSVARLASPVRFRFRGQRKDGLDLRRRDGHDSRVLARPPRGLPFRARDQVTGLLPAGNEEGIDGKSDRRG